MISGGIVLVLTMTDCCKIFTEPGGEKTNSVKEQCTTVIIIFDGIVRKKKKKTVNADRGNNFKCGVGVVS